jgi:hypothetical protein
MMDTSPLALVSVARQREDGTYGTLDPVEVDSLSEDLRVRCVEAIERYRAEHGSAPNAPVIENTGHILASYQTGWASSPPVAVGMPAIIGTIRPIMAIGMSVIVPMGMVRPVVAMGMIVTVGPDDHHRW